MVATLNGYYEGCFHVKLGSKGRRNAHSWSYWATLPLSPWGEPVSAADDSSLGPWGLMTHGLPWRINGGSEYHVQVVINYSDFPSACPSQDTGLFIATIALCEAGEGQESRVR